MIYYDMIIISCWILNNLLLVLVISFKFILTPCSINYRKCLNIENSRAEKKLNHEQIVRERENQGAASKPEWLCCKCKFYWFQFSSFVLKRLLFHSGGQQGWVCGQEDCQVGRWVEKIQGEHFNYSINLILTSRNTSGPNE